MILPCKKDYNLTMDEIKELDQSHWPPALLEIPEPPKQLYLIGKLPPVVDDFIYLTVVGSRKFSHYGREVCQKLIAGLAGYNIVIVSGLALGIDSIAHREALKVGLKTVAWPGSGLARDSIYPRTNYLLAQEILKNGGALLSEFSPETKAAPYTFPRRNRLMAGLAKAVLIIEAGNKSGTLITARLALDYNREVLAVPSSIFSTSGIGSNKLIKEGATPITESQDILDVLGLTNNEEQSLPLNEIQLEPKEKVVYELLVFEPLDRDSLIEKINLPINETNSLLSIMEVKGLIKETGGLFTIL